MKKYIEDEIVRGVLIGILGVDILFVLTRTTGIVGGRVFFSDLMLTACIIIGLALFAAVMRSAGHYRGKEEVTPNYFDKYPLEIYAAGDFLLVLCSFAMFRWINRSAFWPLALAFLGIAYLGIIFGCMSVAVRCKTHTLVTNTLIYRLFAALSGFIRRIKNKTVFYVVNTPLYLKILIIMAAYFAVIITAGQTGAIICLPFVTLFLAANAISYRKIGEGIERIAGGDTEYKIDTAYMPASMAKQALQLNSINNVVSEAVSKRIKSEQLKTELITNVSHDIKTPLTSIINYIDLIQKENITQQPVADYVNVLQRQSFRLKKLIDDLVEASKASTGNIAVHLATTKLNLLLNQAAGEYADRAETRGLELSLRLPEEELYILSDGRLLWRIFDNLLNNACKYSQPGTRVYITLERSGDSAVISFKNVSRIQLNISPEELMERFVRGDSSRNTEGSGLGLSIAQSLTEILNGTMSIEIDGDLFKAVLVFDVI